MKSDTQSTSDTPPLSKEILEDHYWHILLTKGKRPQSVYAFSQSMNIEEAEFYKHASSFESIESGYWDRLVEETIGVLHEDSDYADYTSEQKILAFMFTFFLHAQKNRSRIVEYFPRPGCSSALKPMRKRFIEFAAQLIAQGLEEGSIADRKNLTDKYPQLLFEQLRAIIEFHRKDHSEEFQDTDALIEKSIKLGADVARSGSFDSAFDLGRFLLRKFTVTPR
ncbi:MAG: hypothetical protein ABGY95_12850 [Rubritalea sp.]|uniref:hypothetical protein n=1 Tax=Rubritalea sp. TaxID=2109375 RepID=UPI0032424D40